MGKGQQRGGGRNHGGGRQRSNSPPVGGDNSSLSSGVSGVSGGSGSNGSSGSGSGSKGRNKSRSKAGRNGSNRKNLPKELVTALPQLSTSSISTSGSASGNGNKRTTKKKHSSSKKKQVINEQLEVQQEQPPPPLLVRYGLIIVPLVSIVLMIFTFRALDEGVGVGVGGGAATAATVMMTAPTTSTIIPPSSPAAVFDASGPRVVLPRAALPTMSSLLDDLISKQQHGVQYHQQHGLNRHKQPHHRQPESEAARITPSPKLCSDGITYGYSDWASLRSAIHSLNEITRAAALPTADHDIHANKALPAAHRAAMHQQPATVPTSSPRLHQPMDGLTSAAAAAAKFNSKSTSPALEVEEMDHYFTTASASTHDAPTHQLPQEHDGAHSYHTHYYDDRYDDPLYDYEDDYYYNYGNGDSSLQQGQAGHHDLHSPPDPFVICPGAVIGEDYFSRSSHPDAAPIFVDSEDVIIECESCAVKRGGTHLAFGPNARNVEVRGVTFMNARTSSITFHHNGASVIFDGCTWIGNSGLVNGGAVADLNSTSSVSFFRCEISDSKQSPRKVTGGGTVSGSSLTIRN